MSLELECISSTKINTFETFHTTQEFNIISLSETYLDSTTFTANKNLWLRSLGHKLIYTYHPKNIKQVGASPL